MESVQGTGGLSHTGSFAQTALLYRTPRHATRSGFFNPIAREKSGRTFLGTKAAQPVTGLSESGSPARRLLAFITPDVVAKPRVISPRTTQSRTPRPATGDHLELQRDPAPPEFIIQRIQLFIQNTLLSVFRLVATAVSAQPASHMARNLSLVLLEISTLLPKILSPIDKRTLMSLAAQARFDSSSIDFFANYIEQATCL